MAATDSRPIPLKNTAYRVYFVIWNTSSALVSGAAGLDSEISIDGGAFADCTNEATEIGSSGGYYLDLTSGEMNGDHIFILVKTSTSGAITTPITIYPSDDGDIRVDTVRLSGDATAADNLEAALDGTGGVSITAGLTGNVTGNLSGSVGSVTAGVSLADGAITAAKIASDAITDAKVASDVTIASVTGSVGSVTSGVTVTTNNDKSGYALSGAGVQAIWDALTSALSTANSIGKRIVDNLDATITSRSTLTAAQVWSALTSALTDAGSIGKLLVDNINAAISSRLAGSSYTAPPSAADVWSHTTRTLTSSGAGGATAQEVWEYGTRSLSTNPPTATQIRQEMDTNSAKLSTIASQTADLADGGRLDNLIDTIVANVAAILADTGTDGVAISTAVKQAIADELLKRSASNVDNTAATHSLYEVIMGMFESSITGSTWSIKKSDGSTVFNTRQVTTDENALPITGIS